MTPSGPDGVAPGSLFAQVRRVWRGHTHGRAANPGGGDGPVAAPRMRTAPRGLARSCQGRGACGRAAQRRHARNRSPDSRGHPRLHGPQRAAPPPGCPAPSLARFLQTPPPSENGTQGAPHSRSPSGGPAPGSTAPWRPAGLPPVTGCPLVAGHVSQCGRTESV